MDGKVKDLRFSCLPVKIGTVNEKILEKPIAEINKRLSVFDRDGYRVWAAVNGLADETYFVYTAKIGDKQYGKFISLDNSFLIRKGEVDRWLIESAAFLIVENLFFLKREMGV